MADNTNPRIIVTGDIIRELHMYQGKRGSPWDDCAAGTRERIEWGGAHLLQKILAHTQPGLSALGLQIDHTQPWPEHLKAYAVFAESASGFKSDPSPAPGEKQNKVWRITQALGYGTSFDVPPAEPPVKLRTLTHTDARVLLVDEGAAGFRYRRAKARWPDVTAAALPPWVVLKTSRPVGVGDLWRDLLKASTARTTRRIRLVVIVSSDDLRRDGAPINLGLSWERTIADTCETISNHPQISTLGQAAHVIVVFRREGAVWFDTENAAPKVSARAILDPRLAEGEWNTTLNDNGARVFGQLSVFAAAISLALAKPEVTELHSPSSIKTMDEAMKRGLIGLRQLRFHGHGTVSKDKTPRFPLAEIGNVLNGKLPKRKSHQPPDAFITTTLTFAADNPVATRWTIAAHNEPDNVPLYGLAFQTAIYGPARLSRVPHAKFGDLTTVDRDEIETLRSLRQLIDAYEKGGPQKQPLCIGAFGPPGAGKSFGIKQIAQEILGKDVPFLEFNLSQFSDERDLIGAFHRVRDEVLSGRTPVTFWDEFDAERYKWLQFLLAPMQDGKFQSGQLTHRLGKCIFVFAGATSWDFQHFGPSPDPANDFERALDTDERQAVRKEAQTEFRLKKGPDFISRLNGHINVLGPNRRMKFNFATDKWDEHDLSDITFPVRRALLLRNMLKVKEKDVLEIDRDLLNALLRQPAYRFGSRSLEKVLEPLKVPNTQLRPARLPAPQVLAQHLDPYESFQKLLSENVAFLTQENILELAAAIHENYRLRTDAKNVYDPQFRQKFHELDAAGKAPNVAAAIRIPAVLAVAGLCVLPGKADKEHIEKIGDHIERYLEPLSCEEHLRWMEVQFANGWLQSRDKDAAGKTKRDNDRLLHNCLAPMEELSAADKQKDIDAVKALPDCVDLVDFRVDFFPDLTVPQEPTLSSISDSEPPATGSQNLNELT